MSCCYGWRIRSYATNGRAAPTRNAAPPAVKAGWSRHPKAVVVVLGLVLGYRFFTVGSPAPCLRSTLAMLSTISMVATLTAQTRRSRSMTRSLWSEKR